MSDDPQDQTLPEEDEPQALPKRKVSKKRAKRKAEPAPEPVEEARPVTPPPEPLPQPEMVRIKNLRPQALQITLVADDGTHQERRVPSRGATGPLEKVRLTAYTRSLIEAGHARLLDA